MDTPPLRRTTAFPARLRLTRAADFEAVFDNGRRSSDPLFTVLYRPTGLAHPRLGMTASAKRVRGAVGRNRIRRLIRESFRRARGQMGGIDIVVIVREPAARAPNDAVFTSLESHWARLRRAAPAG